MGFVIRIITVLSFLFALCNNQEKNISRAGTENAGVRMEKVGASLSDTTADDAMPNKAYTNAEFGFTIRYPAAWQSQEHDGRQGRSFVLNLFPSNQELAAKAPLMLHTDAGLSYVAVIPEGWGTELPSGEMKTFSEANPSLQLSFPVSKNACMIFCLENGEPWAYFIVPAATPSLWKNGFIFAQIGVENFRTDCFDKITGKAKDPSHCDPLTGDRVVRTGTIKKGEAEAVKQILSSLRFNKTELNSPPDEGIRIKQPEPNRAVSSPLSVKGEARDSCFLKEPFRWFCTTPAESCWQVALPKQTESG